MQLYGHEVLTKKRKRAGLGEGEEPNAKKPKGDQKRVDVDDETELLSRFPLGYDPEQKTPPGEVKYAVKDGDLFSEEIDAQIQKIKTLNTASKALQEELDSLAATLDMSEAGVDTPGPDGLKSLLLSAIEFIKCAQKIKQNIVDKEAALTALSKSAVLSPLLNPLIEQCHQQNTNVAEEFSVLKQRFGVIFKDFLDKYEDVDAFMRAYRSVFVKSNSNLIGFANALFDSLAKKQENNLANFFMDHDFFKPSEPVGLALEDDPDKTLVYLSAAAGPLSRRVLTWLSPIIHRSPSDPLKQLQVPHMPRAAYSSLGFRLDVGILCENFDPLEDAFKTITANPASEISICKQKLSSCEEKTSARACEAYLDQLHKALLELRKLQTIAKDMQGALRDAQKGLCGLSDSSEDSVQRIIIQSKLDIMMIREKQFWSMMDDMEMDVLRFEPRCKSVPGGIKMNRARNDILNALREHSKAEVGAKRIILRLLDTLDPPAAPHALQFG